ncbi:SubName: Full=Uncharacterized protein {ECO:0000313/EMBL:CCA68905.1} [Serendipita indica DSM 11827]|nr:SubName: Full=Uncharacterized protein {ECO:0000313/EMBL:CCA68905.1} [Serendipita indica DSM 11827]
MADFPLPISEAFLGTLDNPAISQSYRKAVIRPTPTSFTVSLYPPRKQGTNYHYGMRIIPTDVPTSPVESSAKSVRSTKSSKYKEYDIFRRWDDCLDFQRTLEGEYQFIAQRRRKGQPALDHHAKNTLYPAQRAASFDSLPAGPDPSSIALDVHEYIPKLTKKSNLFRANHSTVSQRGEEFKAMINALLDEDAHSTIRELRTVPIVRDFFALWRRDKEAERRSAKTASITSPPLPGAPTAPTVVPVVNTPPPPAPVLAPKSGPAQSTPQRSPTLNHLADFLHTPVTSVPKSPKPAGRNSYATPRGNIRPSTANVELYPSNRPPASLFLATSDAAPGPSTPAVNAANSIPAAASRFSRSQTLPVPNQPVDPLDPVSDAGLRAREGLMLRPLAREDPSSQWGGLSRPPLRKGSSPELARPSTATGGERARTRDYASPHRLQDNWQGFSGGGLQPMPIHRLAQRQPSLPGLPRKATLRESPSVEGGLAGDALKPLTSFPFDHPPESPGSPGVAVPAAGRRRLDSLAVLDPEMYQTLASQGQAMQSSPSLLQFGRSPSIGHDTSQVIPRARKTPPIQDSGNRSARFFVDDPNGNLLVDVANGPPPRSPISAGMGSLTLDPEMGRVRKNSTHSHESDEGQFGQIARERSVQNTRLIGRPPPGKQPIMRPPPTAPLPPTNANVDLRSGRSAEERAYNLSIISGASIPTLSSNASSSSFSQASPLSPTAMPASRFRSRASMSSLGDQQQRRLSLDSLMMSDVELPYLSRNLSNTQNHYSLKNKSSDAVFAAHNAVNGNGPASATPTPRTFGAANIAIGVGGGRGSYSSQDTDSTGLNEDSGALSSASSIHAPAPSRLHPPTKAIIVSKTTPPPPRPPRSALRNSSQFATGVLQRLEETSNGDSSGSRPQTPFNNLHKQESHEFIDSYFLTPQLQPTTLDPPVAPFAMSNRNTRDSNMSTFSNIAQYYQSLPERPYVPGVPAQERPGAADHPPSDFEAMSLPPTPFSTTFLDLTAHNNVPTLAPRTSSQTVSGMVPIKAVHAQSETIVLFKITKGDTSLSDLRAKTLRKLREAGIPGESLESVSLKYLPSTRSGDSAPFVGRQRSMSIASAADIAQMVDLDSEVEWQKALATANPAQKILIRVI